MRQGELLRLFRKNNIRLIDHGKRHDIYYSPITGNRIVVPRHSKEIPVGTAQSILKAAGIHDSE